MEIKSGKIRDVSLSSQRSLAHRPVRIPACGLGITQKLNLLPFGHSRMRTETNIYPLRASDLTLETESVSIIIVVWYAKKYRQECVESLREHCANLNPEVVVVDNCSTDGTAEMVADMFPEFRLIRNPENYGFAKANNIGIAQSSGKYVCLVNSDVKFLDDCISRILEYLRSNPRVAMVGPQMLLTTGGVGRSTMRFPTVWNYLCRAVGLDILFPKS